MKQELIKDFQFPSTRYTGSKRRFLDWIWEHLRDIRFKSSLDVFGGTASVSLLFKRYGKKVNYNDLLTFNQIIGRAIIENNNITVSEKEIDSVLDFSGNNYPNFIQANFKDIFFLDEENLWLDKVRANIDKFKNIYKRSILLAGLFQACLAKRPFNLFHRANLYLRTSNVERTFGNKTTWERPFADLFKRYVLEYNKAIFSNEKKNVVIGGYNALSAPNGVDLVYCDPPYVSSDSSQGTNYLKFYSFLEGLAKYSNWEKRIQYDNQVIPHMRDIKGIQSFSKKSDVRDSFKKLIERFQNNIIVLSYQSGGIPSENEIIELFRSVGKRVKIYRRKHTYVLSSKQKKELLFVAR